jgi:hypothetical protein
MSQHEVISAFLDKEPFDAQELGSALSDPEGRALLFDLIALHHLVQPDETMAIPLTQASRVRSGWRLAAVAAMFLLAVAGGYMARDWRVASETGAQAPAPTRVIQASPFSPNGGIQ